MLPNFFRFEVLDKWDNKLSVLKVTRSHLHSCLHKPYPISKTHFKKNLVFLLGKNVYKKLSTLNYPSSSCAFYFGSVFRVLICPLRLTLTWSHAWDFAPERLNLKDSEGRGKKKTEKMLSMLQNSWGNRCLYQKSIAFKKKNRHLSQKALV